MALKATTKSLYGAEWDAGLGQLALEMTCIRYGGNWSYQLGGVTRHAGLGLFQHYKNVQQLLWPEDDVHRWSDLALQTIIENKIVGFMGCSDSNKTYSSAKYALTDYFCFPAETCTLVSSTDVRGLELRVWGAIKDLFNRARERYPELPGNVLNSLHTITSDSINDRENEARRLNRGIICIPCLQSGRYVGLKNYVGIKQRRMRLIADECQLMGESFLDALPNLMGKGQFKGVFLGNPNDPDDPLGRVCEPEGGWESHPEPTQTTVWPTRFLGGKCVNFVGTDSPNFDAAPEQPIPYPYMINRRKLAEVEAFWGRDSHQWYSQCIGVMKTGLLSKRIITKELCLQHHAFDKAVWKGTARTKIYAVDAAYGGQGGDRCVGGWIEFGESIDEIQIVRVNGPVIIPVNIRENKLAEDQIAEYVKDQCAQYDIKTEHIFYDSTGRGTLGSAFARVFGNVTPVPVEFGGRPTKRPVRHDLFVYDHMEKRHKYCDEHYLDFISELWFSVRYVIECDQLRELPQDVMREGSQREFGTAGGNKLFVESKHDPKARERMRRSPDLFDWLVTAVEGARQCGFQIQRLGATLTEVDDDEWDESELDTILKKHLLSHAA